MIDIISDSIILGAICGTYVLCLLVLAQGILWLIKRYF